jgi:hypothetical protein
VVLVAVHFLLRPLVDAWFQFGYVRYAAARTAPAARIAPGPLAEYPWWWHELTRLTHALVHDPAGHHAHVVGNVVVIVVGAATLFALLAALGRREWFALVYWELIVVAPVVGSFAFDLFGETAHGYGASTIAFAFLGAVLVTGLAVLGRSVGGDVRRRLHGRGAASRSVRPDGGVTAPAGPIAVGALLLAVGVIVVADLVGGSPAMPVHQAGVGFGACVGAVALVASVE